MDPSIYCILHFSAFLRIFTNTVSHKMIRCALSETKGRNVKIARSHSSSMAALKTILEEHTS